MKRNMSLLDFKNQIEKIYKNSKLWDHIKKSAET